jgi:hypothetical protein
VDDRAWRWTYEHLRERALQLAGPNPNPLVAALAATAAACFLEYEHRLCTLQLDETEDEADKYRGRALRRWLTAARTLAVVQKMRPARIQINLAQNQIVANAAVGPQPEGRG